MLKYVGGEQFKLWYRGRHIFLYISYFKKYTAAMISFYFTIWLTRLKTELRLFKLFVNYEKKNHSEENISLHCN